MKIKRHFLHHNLWLFSCYRYLTDHIPDLAVLPVTVSVSLLKKGIQMPDVRLKPQDRYSAYVVDVIVTLLKRQSLIIRTVYALCMEMMVCRIRSGWNSCMLN